MRRLAFGLLFCVVILGTTITSCFAESEYPEQRVQLVEDQENGVLSIQIDGELVAFFTKDGLHVVKDIEYGGTFTDAGMKNTVKLFESLKIQGETNEK